MAETFLYVTYIATTPEKLWAALTSAEFTRKYWFGTSIRSAWTEGASVEFIDGQGRRTDEGEVLHVELHRVLSYTFRVVGDATARKRPSRVTYILEPMGSAVKLTLKHEDLRPEDLEDGTVRTFGVQNGWPVVVSGLKTVLETGQTLALKR